MEIRRAVVFPGQGTAGGEVTGELGDLIKRYEVGGETPYQLSVFARSVELLHWLSDAGVEPDVVAGHSLGEYAAAHAAGSLALGDAVRLVAERDRLMNEASKEHPGGDGRRNRGGPERGSGGGGRGCRRRRRRRRRRELQYAASDGDLRGEGGAGRRGLTDRRQDDTAVRGRGVPPRR